VNGLNPATLAGADQEFAAYLEGVDDLVVVTREMLADVGPIATVSALGYVLNTRSEACPMEARKTSFILATALIRLAQSGPS
jgi:hypothetical protein